MHHRQNAAGSFAQLLPFRSYSPRCYLPYRRLQLFPVPYNQLVHQAVYSVQPVAHWEGHGGVGGCGDRGWGAGTGIG